MKKDKDYKTLCVNIQTPSDIKECVELNELKTGCKSCNTKYVIGDNNTCFQKIPNCKTQINSICNACQGNLTLKTNKCIFEKNID